MRPPDPNRWDANLSVVRSSADDAGAWLAIWSATTEPDAHARRCASDAVGAADAALLAWHELRARLIGEIRQADDATAARADALLARTDALLARVRAGPPGAEGGPPIESRLHTTPTSPPPGAEATPRVADGTGSGREATPC